VSCTTPCVADPPKIDCTLEPFSINEGDTITVKVQSDEQLKSLRVFLKQPKCSSKGPLVVQNMMGRECIAIDMKRKKGNNYVGHIDTSDLIRGEALIKAYATDILAVDIK
jgi:hypothetical protein